MSLFSSKPQARDFEKLVDDLREALASRDLDEVPQIRQLRQRFENGVEDFRDAAARAARETAVRAREHAEVADRYVHESPWQTAGIAAAAGVVLGFLLARR